MVYASWEDSFELLTVEEQAQFLKNLFLYNKGEEPILNTSGLKMLWTTIRFTLEKDKQSYDNKVEGAKKARQAHQADAEESPIPHTSSTPKSLISEEVLLMSPDIRPIGLSSSGKVLISYAKDKEKVKEKAKVKEEDIGKDSIINNIRIMGFDRVFDNL